MQEKIKDSLLETLKEWNPNVKKLVTIATDSGSTSLLSLPAHLWVYLATQAINLGLVCWSTAL